MAGDLFTVRLLSGERILWSGNPGQGLLLTEADTFAIPFSLLWCGFVIFWTIGATRTAGVGPLLIGGIFICFGLYNLVGRFLVDAWIRRDLSYAVTNRRILIARPAPISRFTALNLEHLSEIDLKERTNGRGTIRFGRRAPSAAWAWGYYRGMGPALGPTPQFLAIGDARRVFDLIQRTARRESAEGGQSLHG
jgi:hypothetical protein